MLQQTNDWQVVACEKDQSSMLLPQQLDMDEGNRLPITEFALLMQSK
jgi:hypothetical protein